MRVSCRDLGMDCDFVAIGATHEEILEKGFQHASVVHGMTREDFTPELIGAIIKMTVEEA